MQKPTKGKLIYYPDSGDEREIARGAWKWLQQVKKDCVKKDAYKLGTFKLRYI